MAASVGSEVGVAQVDVGVVVGRVGQLGDALHTASVRIGELGGESTLGAGTTVALVATMVLDGIGYWVVMNLGD